MTFIEQLSEEYAADQLKATEDYKQGVIPTITDLDCLRNSRWHRYMMDVARLEHQYVGCGLMHVKFRQGLLDALEWRYAAVRDSFLVSETSRTEYADRCVALFVEFFSTIRDWGCIASVPTDDAIRVYVLASIDIAETSGVSPSDVDALAGLCSAQRVISVELVQWVAERYGNSGCW